MPRAFVAIGSNIDPVPNIRAALRALREAFAPLACSPVYESRPIGFDGGNFLNLVVAFDTPEAPQALVAALHAIEQQLGRVRVGERFSSRIIDLDLVLYGDWVRNEPGLVLPRPELREYACLLRPLIELDPTVRDPVSGKTWLAVWHDFDQASQPLTPVALAPD
jgi:2-amino-4-hydroxy-6-hydroxymethyldihydropteridine diphosphokinase